MRKCYTFAFTHFRNSAFHHFRISTLSHFHISTLPHSHNFLGLSFFGEKCYNMSVFALGRIVPLNNLRTEKGEANGDIEHNGEL